LSIVKYNLPIFPEKGSFSMMRPIERVISALSREWVDRPPVCCMTTSVTVDQMRAVGSYWPGANTDAREMANLAMAAHSVVGFESVRIPFCLTVEAEVLGATVDLGKMDRTPMIKGHNLTLGDEVPIPETMEDRGRIPVVLESIPMLGKMTAGEVPVIPLAVSLLMGILQDPGAVHDMVGACSRFCMGYLENLETAGADAILISNPSASAEMLSREMHEEFSAQYTKSALAGVREAKTVIHICGASTPLLENMISLGVDGLSVEEKVDPFEAVEIVKGRAALVGNVGVVSPLLQGTPGDVKRETLRTMKAGFDIINPGCGLAPGIPMENLRTMVRTVKGY
jgi:[methyl-Co(III) methanol-specific corrinoid protein]:coenzyme M methyltransferase